ncbi:hypothetical protein E2562_011381, partial [Oryza meyeriana var. granulata]
MPSPDSPRRHLEQLILPLPPVRPGTLSPLHHKQTKDRGLIQVFTGLAHADAIVDAICRKYPAAATRGR